MAHGKQRQSRSRVSSRPTAPGGAGKRSRVSAALGDAGHQEVSYLRISDERDGQRLDNFLLARLKGVPKSHIYRIIRSGEVRINKGRCKPTQRLVVGDTVRVPPIRLAARGQAAPVSRELAEKLSRCRVYEDDALWVYNKPAGLAVHGGSGISLGLIETLRSLFPEEQSLELVHRLDRDTSGLVMVARKRRMLQYLQRLIRDGGIDKRYWLLCQTFAGRERNIDAPLLKLMQGNERIVRVSRDGKASLTRFTLKERLAHGQWLEAELVTGRTHQIRVHAQYGGFPILGDSKYGNREANAWLTEQGVTRLCLHANKLTFRHPISGKELCIEAPTDDAFDRALQKMRV